MYSTYSVLIVLRDGFDEDGLTSYTDDGYLSEAAATRHAKEECKWEGTSRALVFANNDIGEEIGDCLYEQRGDFAGALVTQ